MRLSAYNTERHTNTALAYHTVTETLWFKLCKLSFVQSACSCACVCVCACLYVLRVVSTDTILHLINTLITNIITVNMLNNEQCSSMNLIKASNTFSTSHWLTSFKFQQTPWAVINLSWLKFSNRHVDRSCSKLAVVQQHDCEVAVARLQPVITTEPPLS